MCDFPGGPVVMYLPSNSGDMGFIPGWGTKISQAVEQLSPQAEPTQHNYWGCAFWRPSVTIREACGLQLVKPVHHSEDPVQPGEKKKRIIFVIQYLIPPTAKGYCKKRGQFDFIM